MNLLDNIDQQLEEMKEVKESQKEFKSSKVRTLIKTKNTRKGFFEKKDKTKSDLKFRKKIAKINKKAEKKRKYKRCPKKYETYINSHWWEKRKNKYYQDHKKICAICNTAQYITLHHIVYIDLGNEKDEHLIPLCSRHHKGYHEQYGVKRNMLKTTLEYVEVEKIKCKSQ